MFYINALCIKLKDYITILYTKLIIIYLYNKRIQFNLIVTHNTFVLSL